MVTEHHYGTSRKREITLYAEKKDGNGAEFEPGTAEDPPYRKAMHVKSVESSNILPLPSIYGPELAAGVSGDRALMLLKTCHVEELMHVESSLTLRCVVAVGTKLRNRWVVVSSLTGSRSFGGDHLNSIEAESLPICVVCRGQLRRYPRHLIKVQNYEVPRKSLHVTL
ncbi:hypothetical protein TNCV_3798261 [Trichonephila clavipes]|nr:hypothetical protein TNCV_3798261 [Trichonephila clavipes]